MTLFYIGKTEMDISSWEEIVLSLITYTDNVWLPSYTLPPNKIEDIKVERIKNTFEELKESKILLTWNFEFSELEYTKPDKVISLNEHLAMREGIDVLFKNAKNNLELKSSIGIERTSKFINYKNDLWNMVIADSCDANGFIAREKENLNFLADKSFEYERKYFENLFFKFQVSNLWTLTTEQILQLKKLIGKTRIEVDALIKKKLLHTENVEAIFSEDINKRYSEYNKLVNEIVMENFGKGTLGKGYEEAMINFVGIFIWQVSFMPLITRTIGSLFNKRRNSFIAYMSELKQLTGY